MLYNVAMLYVEAKRNTGGPHSSQDTDMAPIGNEFDVYLSALGFMPVDEAVGGDVGGVVGGAGTGGLPPPALASPTGAEGGGTFPTGAMAVQQQQQQQQQQTNQLGDWFSGNRYMMGLLEEDLSQFHPNTWNHAGV